MKRKVKFQEGGEVSMSAAEWRRANIERLNARRAVEDFNRREQTGQLDERTMRRAGGTPVTSEVADFNRRMQSGQLDAETMRRMGGTPSGSANALRSGAGMTPSAGGSAMSRMVPRVGMAAGLLGLGDLAWRAYNALPERARSQEDLDVMEAYRTGRDVREVRAAREAAARPAVTPDQMQTADVPGNRATSGAGAPAAARMREVDMQGGDVPGNVAMNPPARPQPTRRPAAPARRESVTADDLNAMVLRLQGGAAPQTETERRLADRMGIAYRKGGLVKPMKHGGKEEAAEMKGGRYRGGMKEEMAEMMPMMKGGKKTAMKKGGAVKAPAKKMKTGGKVPAPKKMMKGGITSKPKVKPKMYAKGGMAKGCK